MEFQSQLPEIKEVFEEEGKSEDSMDRVIESLPAKFVSSGQGYSLKPNKFKDH